MTTQNVWNCGCSCGGSPQSPSPSPAPSPSLLVARVAPSTRPPLYIPLPSPSPPAPTPSPLFSESDLEIQAIMREGRELFSGIEPLDLSMPSSRTCSPVSPWCAYSQPSPAALSNPWGWSQPDIPRTPPVPILNGTGVTNEVLDLFALRRHLTVGLAPSTAAAQAQIMADNVTLERLIEIFTRNIIYFV